MRGRICFEEYSRVMFSLRDLWNICVKMILGIWIFETEERSGLDVNLGEIHVTFMLN